MISLDSAMKSFQHFIFLLPSCKLKAKYVTFWVMIIRRLTEIENHPYSQNTNELMSVKRQELITTNHKGPLSLIIKTPCCVSFNLSVQSQMQCLWSRVPCQFFSSYMLKVQSFHVMRIATVQFLYPYGNLTMCSSWFGQSKSNKHVRRGLITLWRH